MSIPAQPVEIRSFPRDGTANKTIYFMPLQQLSLWPEKISLPSRHFGVLLLCDGNAIPDSTVVNLASRMLSQGLAYLCAWGPDCERIHDLFDEAIIENPNDLIKSDSVIMTTSHDEPLEDAVWYFLYLTVGAGEYWKTCQSWIVVPVERADWTEKARLLALEL